MSTSFEITKLSIPSAKMNGTSSLPPFTGHQPGKRSGDFGTDEYAGLFIDYGVVNSVFPYRAQNNYGRELYPHEEDVIVLENEYLRAVFMPHYGAKLMSLIDKEKGRDLLFCNPVIRPCNLATRGAWTSGGVEWNCGIFGHHVRTCDDYFCAKTYLDDGTPVLRCYEFERIRCAVIQMDFFLPEGSRLLYARMRVTNTTREVTPMYWWSNIAVPEEDGSRVITWANGAYIGNNNVSEAPVPIRDGIDISYPENIATAYDNFYNIPDNKRKFECLIYKDGYGFVQTSTSRLVGRKLFVWGQGGGGKRWRNYLTADDCDGGYVELQAGLAHTQYESLPMPPSTTWEWLEGYGAITTDPAKAHGEWIDAQTEADRALNEIITEDALEEMLVATRDMATRPAEEAPFFMGSGWGALENMRRAKAKERLIAPHLDFGEVGKEQEAWVSLLNNSYMTEPDVNEVPASYMLQNEWIAMLEKSCATCDSYNWYAHYQLAAIYCAMRRWKDAEREIGISMELKPSPWGVYTRGRIELEKSNPNEGAILCMKASQMLPTDPSLAKEAIALMVCLGMHQQALDYLATLPDEIKNLGRVKLFEFFAYVRLENIEEAERIIMADGGLVVPDIREGEGTLTQLYIELQQMKAKREGKELKYQDVEVPRLFDFR